MNHPRLTSFGHELTDRNSRDERCSLWRKLRDSASKACVSSALFSKENDISIESVERLVTTDLSDSVQQLQDLFLEDSPTDGPFIFSNSYQRMLQTTVQDL